MNSDLIGHEPVLRGILGIFKVRGKVWFKACHVYFLHVTFKFVHYIHGMCPSPFNLGAKVKQTGPLALFAAI